MPITCDLLIHASPSVVFDRYTDPLHWNIQFSGIAQAHLESALALHARGAVMFHRAGRWKIRITTLHDDHLMIIRARHGIITITFWLEIRPLHNQNSRVRHRLTGNLIGKVVLSVYKNNLYQWLYSNLLIVQKVCAELQTHTSITNQKPLPRKQSRTLNTRPSRTKKSN